MAAILLLACCVGPLIFAGGVVVIALSLFVQGLTLASFAACVVLVTSTPLMAACGTATLYRWCFPSGSARLTMNAAGLLALLALLSDRDVLSMIARIASDPAQIRPLASIFQIVSTTSFVGALSLAVVMFAVLLLEVPLRWFISKEVATTWEGVVRTVRVLGTIVVIVIGWGVINEFARARLSAMLGVFS